MENEEDTIWGGLLRLYDKVKKVSEDREWPELLEMVNEQVFKDLDKSTEAEKLFDNESFMMRLCIRYENFHKSPFNVVTILRKNYEDYVRIGNYDFKTYVWAKKLYDYEINNNFIYIPFEKLNEKQIKAFKKKAINNYEEEE